MLYKQWFARIGLSLCAAALFAAAPHSVTLTWTDTLNPTGTTYNVYRAPSICSGTPVFAVIATGIDVMTYLDPPLPAGHYCYQVTATFDGEESPPSNQAQVTILPYAPTTLKRTINR